MLPDNLLSRLVRPQNFVLVVGSFLWGFWFTNGTLHSSDVLSPLLILFCIHSAGQSYNTLCDEKIDAINKRSLIGEGKLSRGQVTAMIYCFLSLTLLFLIVVGGISWGFALAELSLLLIYNDPLRLSYRPLLGPLTVSLGYCTVPFLWGGLLYGATSSYTLWLALTGLSLIRFAVTLLKDFGDMEGDQKMDKQTFVGKYGLRKTVLISALTGVAGYLLVISSLYASNLPLFDKTVIILFAIYPLLYRYRLMAASTMKMGRDTFYLIFQADARYVAISLLLIYFAKI